MELGFNPAQYQPYTGVETMPAGDYMATIEDLVAERVKDDPNSGLLKVTFVIAPGSPFANRKLYSRLNLWNASDASKETAHKQLTSLCYACGHTGVLQNTDQLKGKQCVIAVTNDGTYNNVKMFKDVAGNIPGKTNAPATAPVSAPPATGFAPPAGFAPAGAVAGGFNPLAATAAPAPPPSPFAAPVAFPPPDWTPHPTAPGYFYKGQEVLTESDLRAKLAPSTPPPPFGAPAGFVSPQAQPPANPAQGFTPQAQATAPTGWPGQ